MKEWKQVTCCPYCGGRLIVSDHYSFTRDYRVTKKGTMSSRYTVSAAGYIDCTTASCLECKAVFDSDMVAIEGDGKVYLEVEGE